MAITIALPSQAISQAVGVASAAFGAMGASKPIGIAAWRFVSTTACYLAQGATPVATAASMAVAAGEVVYLDGNFGVQIAVLQQAAGGTATLTPVVHF